MNTNTLGFAIATGILVGGAIGIGGAQAVVREDAPAPGYGRSQWLAGLTGSGLAIGSAALGVSMVAGGIGRGDAQIARVGAGFVAAAFAIALGTPVGMAAEDLSRR